MTTDLLTALRGNEEFVAALRDAAKHRPLIPDFNLAATETELYMIVERIKYHTAMRQGFDLLYQHLTGRKPGE